MKTVAALFVQENGIYYQFPEVDPWPESRDARLYNGDLPVVSHPPCQLWINLAAANYGRAIAKCDSCNGKKVILNNCQSCKGTGRKEPNRKVIIPAWHPGGNDGGCFASALSSVRKYGGVLEHPAGSHAWMEHNILSPIGIERGSGAWCKDTPSTPDWDCQEYWVCEVWQSAYGHAARKRTWLLYCGARPPFELRWDRNPGTHQVGWTDKRGKDKNKPTLSKKAANATPIAFAETLIELAKWSR